jgi:MFS transporter, DHA1 family, tetracycline resistance protein
MSLWGIATPSLQALMTRSVDSTEQGRLQGALASLTGLASLIGPTLFTQILAAAIDGPVEMSAWPGSPFLVSALIVFIAMILAWRTTRSLAPVAVAAPP